MSIAHKIHKGEKPLQRRTTPSMVSPWDEMDRWFSDFARRGWLHPFTWEWPKEMETLAPFEGRMPSVDMIDRDDEVVVRAELPGVNKDDLEVTLSEHTLAIEAHTKREEEEEKGEYYRKEMTRGDFRRTLALPGGLDEDKAKATFTDGVLELCLPKLEKTSRKKVEVK